jgi:SAM-dependent methyltransferase
VTVDTSALDPGRQGGLRLPPRGALPKPDPDDPLDLYYRPLTAGVYRARLRLARRLLGRERHEALLEVGYGSGIFLPELERHAERLVAIDLHDQASAVGAALDQLGVRAELRRASLFEMPFDTGEFDALVCLSVLEHLTTLDRALDELSRVLRPGGVAVIGFPTRNPITDAFFRSIGYDPREIHPSGHSDIISAIEGSDGLRLETCVRLPRWMPLSLSAYVACRAQR